MDLSKRKVLKSGIGLTILLTGGPFLSRTKTVLASTGLLPSKSVPLAGFEYHQGPSLWASLKTGDPLRLVREADNPHDTYAVKVLWKGQKLGYLPRTHNQPAARMVDQGDLLHAYIYDLKDSHDPWQRVKIAFNKEA